MFLTRAAILQRHAPWGASSKNCCLKHLVHNDDAPSLDAAGQRALLAQAGAPPVCVCVRLVTFNLEDVFGTHPQKLVRTCKYEKLELQLHVMPAPEGGACRILVVAALPPYVTQNGPALQQAGQIRNLFDIFRRVNGIYQWNGENTEPEAFSQMRRLMSDLEKACGEVEDGVYLGADADAGLDPSGKLSSCVHSHQGGSGSGGELYRRALKEGGGGKLRRRGEVARVGAGGGQCMNVG